ncbi:MAG: HEAT repeat domain-containing protein [Planctomycetales bacterium]|nr:HEAT repeat domain-containing protein [Planctomycetales bacterium]
MSAPEDNLPPVQPPSASFLMQLFVVPLVIVVAIVMVSLMFNWLAHMGTKPEDLVTQLNKVNPGSWQKALTVANLLTDHKHEDLRRDPKLAEKVAELLEKELEQGSADPERVKLRVYLTLALGLFEVENGRETLIKAATQQKTPVDVEVRKTALETFARRADFSPERCDLMRNDQELMQAVEQAAKASGESSEEREAANELRLRAAYVLGVIGGDQALQLLTGLASDPEPLVRFNAATALARLGERSAVPRLYEMLEIYQQKNDDGSPRFDAVVQTSVISSAIRAIEKLAEQDQTIDRAELADAIQSVLDSPDISSDVRTGVEIDARTALQHLGK